MDDEDLYYEDALNNYDEDEAASLDESGSGSFVNSLSTIGYSLLEKKLSQELNLTPTTDIHKTYTSNNEGFNANGEAAVNRDWTSQKMLMMVGGGVAAVVVTVLLYKAVK